jgi:hypothetical protein
MFSNVVVKKVTHFHRETISWSAKVRNASLSGYAITVAVHLWPQARFKPVSSKNQAVDSFVYSSYMYTSKFWLLSSSDGKLRYISKVVYATKMAELDQGCERTASNAAPFF